MDLGCEYTIKVDERRVRVAASRDGLGGVSVGRQRGVHPGRGAVRRTQAADGTGHPVVRGRARVASRRPLERFEGGNRAALDDLLAAARPRDGLTVWHLLTRVPCEADRGLVFDRFVQLVAVPRVSREAVLRRDARLDGSVLERLEPREYRLVARMGEALGIVPD